MRDLTASWPAIPDWETAQIDVGNVTVRSLSVGTQHLVSGNLPEFVVKAGLPGTGAGAFGETIGERYGLRIARDRILVIDGLPEAMDGGWHVDGYAVTDVSAMYHVFEIEGMGIEALIGEATAMDPDSQSPSAMILFAGQQAIVYYNQGRLRVHIERGFAPYLWQWLEARD